MEFEELKSLVLKKIEEYPEYKFRAMQELMRANIAYQNNINIVDEINKLNNNDDLSDGYILPFFLGITSRPTALKPIELKQHNSDSSGGLDVDVDLSSAGKPLVKAYLEEKYGKDHIMSVGTYMTIQVSSAIRDILRRENVPFAEVNKFCSELDPELSFEENMERYRQNFKPLYEFYLAHKVGLSYVPKICNMFRGMGKHAGGIVILDKPVYEYIPVIRVQGELATAFTESGASQELDMLGLIKLDMLAISQLDIIDNALTLAEKDGFFEIEDDDGIKKIVSKAYLMEKGMTPEEIERI